jgi:hypothetical protein
MDLIKQYIVQCISASANNLRLNAPQIEVVALLRETIMNSPDIGDDINRMKKVTEFSTLAIRLNEIYTFLTLGTVDMLRLSDRFKEHSQYLIKDLNNMLVSINPAAFKTAVAKLYPMTHEAAVEEIEEAEEKTIDVNLSKRTPDEYEFEQSEEETEKAVESEEEKYFRIEREREEEAAKKREEEAKERSILEEESRENELSFERFEREVLRPIKPLDAILKEVNEWDELPEELYEYIDVMRANAFLSSKIGFAMLKNMHNMVADSLELIHSGKLNPEKNVVEALRACLIVIVAVVRGKEIDISNYLKRTNEFGKTIKAIKSKE